jgi:LysB family phage lysis regulatory protein
MGLKSTLIAAAVALALAAALYVQGLRLDAAKADLTLAQQHVATLEAGVEAGRKALRAAESEARRRDKAIVDRDTAVATINSRRDDTRRATQEAVRNDQAVRDWYNSPLPAAVRDRLRAE